MAVQALEDPALACADKPAKPESFRTPSLQELRSEVLTGVLGMVLVTGTVPACLAVYEDFVEGRHFFAGFYLVMWLAGCALAFFRRVPFQFRASLLVFLFLLLAVWEAWWFGVRSNAVIFFMGFVVFSSVFFSLRISIAALLLATILLMAESLAHVHALPREEAFKVWMGNWAGAISSFAFMSTACVYFIARLFRNVDAGIRSSQGLVACLQREVAEREAMATSLAQSEARYRLMTEHTSEVIFEADETGRTLFVSPSVLKVLGRKPEELAGLHLHEWLCRETDQEPLSQELERVLLGEKSHIADDLEFVREDGMRIWCEVRVFSLCNTVSRAVRLHGVIRDVSWRKQLEDRLLHSQKMEAVGVLAGGIAHDFNNLLAGIMGSAELMGMNKELPPQASRSVNNILECTRRGANLTRQLLDFARKGTGLQISIDLPTLLRHVAELLSHTIDRRVSIRLCIEPAACVVAGDPDRLQHAVMNLCLNARDAMPEGGELTLGLHIVELPMEFWRRHPDMPPGPCARIRVGDTGVGIEPALTARIFDPFFTTKPQGKGTGLGLSSVMGCVRTHNGCLEVESMPGKGSEFSIFLPIAFVNEVPQPGASEAPLEPCAGEHLLIVDDEWFVLGAMGDSLRAFGYRTESYDSPLAALAWFREYAATVDLVLLDMNMPEMSGLELLRELRAISPGIRAIIVTGYTGQENREHVLKEGVLGIVEKPARRETLLRAVACALKSQ